MFQENHGKNNKGNLNKVVFLKNRLWINWCFSKYPFEQTGVLRKALFGSPNNAFLHRNTD